jgi:hypothetical protein
MDAAATNAIRMNFIFNPPPAPCMRPAIAERGSCSRT